MSCKDKLKYRIGDIVRTKFGTLSVIRELSACQKCFSSLGIEVDVGHLEPIKSGDYNAWHPIEELELVVSTHDFVNSKLKGLGIKRKLKKINHRVTDS